MYLTFHNRCLLLLETTEFELSVTNMRAHPTHQQQPFPMRQIFYCNMSQPIKLPSTARTSTTLVALASF